MAFPPAFMRADSARRIRAMPLERRLRLLRGASEEFKVVYTALERHEGLPTSEQADFFSFTASSRVVVYDASHVDPDDPSGALSDFASRLAEAERSRGQLDGKEVIQEPVFNRPSKSREQEPCPSPGDPMPAQEDVFDYMEPESEHEDTCSLRPNNLIEGLTWPSAIDRPESFLALLTPDEDAPGCEPGASNEARPSQVPLAEKDAMPVPARRMHLCASAGCRVYLSINEFCKNHSTTIARRICPSPGCHNNAHYRGGFCKKHCTSRPRALCRIENCDRLVCRGGLCQSHGPRCSTPGCSTPARRAGKCYKCFAHRVV